MSSASSHERQNTEKTSVLPSGTRRWRDKCARVLEDPAQGTGAEAGRIRALQPMRQAWCKRGKQQLREVWEPMTLLRLASESMNFH